MRHGISGNKFGRNQKLRQATVRDLARAVVKHERISTTRAKAAEARKLIDKLITLGKKNTLATKRRAFAVLIDHSLVSYLFNTIAPRFKDRQGGYTRIIKFTVNRPGDNAEMVLLELTEKGSSKESSAEAKVQDAEIVEVKGEKKLNKKKDEVKAPASSKKRSKK